jgi:transmembrane sensor
MDMFDTELQISVLIAAHLQGNITEVQQAQLENWLEQRPENREHFEKAYQEYILSENLRIYESADRESIWRKTMARIHADKKIEVPVRKLYPFRRIAVAAAIAALIFGAGLFYEHLNIQGQTDQVVYKNDIAPGKSGAILTLANGKKVRLSDAANGEVAKEAGITITKTADGQVVYSVSSSQNEAKQSYNTLTTAKGETYMLTLPDKTTVWLNAASTIKYSASLNTMEERRVQLSGEAYFQVSKDKKHPFIVETNKQTIKVLGTHFNVNAYEDEGKTRTTLLEGSVQVSIHTPVAGGAEESEILKPNQQAILNSGKFHISDVDAQDAIAWQQGYFAFNSETLEEIMNRVERWYDVKVIFEDPSLKKETFIGSVSKYEQVSKVLRLLAGTNTVTFKIEGSTIRVSRKE